MELFSWIVVGAIAGWLGGHLLKGRGFGLLGDILVGGWLAGGLFKVTNVVNGINLTSILVEFLGANVLIFIVRMVKGQGRERLFHR